MSGTAERLKIALGRHVTPPVGDRDQPWCKVGDQVLDLARPAPLKGPFAHAARFKQAHLEILGEYVDVEYLHLRITHATDFSPLSKISRLVGLFIEYAPRLRDLSPLATLPNLRGLKIEACKNANDFGTLRDTNLRWIHVAGGMWKNHKLNSVAPFADMSNLECLEIDGMDVGSEDIRVLEESSSLEKVFLPLGLPLEDYAYMKAKRPDLLPDDFSPFLPAHDFEGKDLLLIAKTRYRRRTFSSANDAEMVSEIRHDFDRLVAEYVNG